MKQVLGVETIRSAEELQGDSLDVEVCLRDVNPQSLDLGFGLDSKLAFLGEQFKERPQGKSLGQLFI